MLPSLEPGSWCGGAVESSRLLPGAMNVTSASHTVIEWPAESLYQLAIGLHPRARLSNTTMAQVPGSVRYTHRGRRLEATHIGVRVRQWKQKQKQKQKLEVNGGVLADECDKAASMIGGSARQVRSTSTPYRSLSSPVGVGGGRRKHCKRAAWGHRLRASS